MFTRRTQDVDIPKESYSLLLHEVNPSLMFPEVDLDVAHTALLYLLLSGCCPPMSVTFLVKCLLPSKCVAFLVMCVTRLFSLL